MNKFFIRKQASYSDTYNFQSLEDRKRYINKDNSGKAMNALNYGVIGGGLSGWGGFMWGMKSDNLRRAGKLGIGLGALGALTGGLYGALSTKRWNRARQKANKDKWDEITDNGRKRGKLTTKTIYYPIFL